MASRSLSAPAAAHGVAVWILVGMAVVSPWAFGSVLPLAAQMVAVLALLGAVYAAARSPEAVAQSFDVFPAWPLGAILGLTLLQLIPLPAGAHSVLAPGSAAVWRPADPTVAAVLGAGPHPVSIHPEATARWLVFALSIAALALAAAPALRRRSTALRACVILLAGGLAVAVYGVVARPVLGNKLYGVFAVPTIAPLGPFVSKNHFAGYVEGLALLALGLALGLADHARRDAGFLGWIDGARAPRVVWAAGAAAALGLAVGVSLSRGGVFALVAGVVAFGLLHRTVRHRRARTLRGTLTAGAALVFVAAVGFALLPEEARERIRGMGSAHDELSGSYRLDVWSDTLRLSRTSPVLGTGFGAYEDALPRFKTAAGELHVEHAENDWLELLAEGGAVALGLVLVLVALAFRRVVGGLRAHGDRLHRGIGLGALTGVTSLLVHSLVDFNLRIPSNALVFAGLVALAAGASRPLAKESPANERSDGRPRRAWLPPVAVTALTLALLAALGVPWQQGRTDLGSLRLPAVRPDAPLRHAVAEESLVRRLRTRPTDAPAWAALAWLRRQEDPAGARALAAHALWLDPLHPGLRAALHWAEAASGAEPASLAPAP